MKLTNFEEIKKGLEEKMTQEAKASMKELVDDFYDMAKKEKSVVDSEEE